MQPIDIRFDFSKFNDQRGWCRFTWDGGKVWWYEDRQLTPSEIIEQTVNVYRVRNFLAPGNGNLCYPCERKGQVGRMKFDRIIEGTEKVCKVIHDEDCSYTDDVEIYCRYRIEKCDCCGREDSDYA